MNENLKSFIKKNWYNKAGNFHVQRVDKTSPAYQTVLKITSFLPDTSTDRERVFCVLNDITSIPKCNNCGNSTKFNKHYRQFCSLKCRRDGASIVYDKVKKTMLDKYGVEHNTQINGAIKKRKEKYFKNHGVYSSLQNPKIRKQIEQTNIERYGSKHTFTSPIISEKIKQTNIDRYGSDKPFKSKKIQQKVKKTFLEKYGSVNASQSHIPNNILNLIDNYDWLYDQHHSQKKSLVHIAKEVNVSPSIIQDRFHKLKIPINIWFTSQPQREIVNFIESIYTGTIIQNDRKILTGQELDILLPELNLAIEINGIYWHSELNGKDKKYHINKTKTAQKYDIQLLHVTDQEWYEKQNLIKNKIKNKLFQSKKIYARKCVVKLLTDHNIVKDFLNQHHIQGYRQSIIYLGLFFESELIAVMTFSKPRYNKKYQYELIRYSTKGGYSVVGGASKLFSFFLKQYNPISIISYCDMRYGTGNLYKKLNFVYSHWSAPNYKYFKTNDVFKLFSRENFQKHKQKKKLKTFYPHLTEWENMVNNGYDRIWDCGNTVWVYNAL